jgi:hypothetical protein
MYCVGLRGDDALSSAELRQPLRKRSVLLRGIGESDENLHVLREVERLQCGEDTLSRAAEVKLFEQRKVHGE